MPREKLKAEIRALAINETKYGIFQCKIRKIHRIDYLLTRMFNATSYKRLQIMFILGFIVNLICCREQFPSHFRR